jgi:glycerol-3-phosphate dehydrogenase
MSAFDRREGLARLAEEEFDVLVVGGGITGAGIALDAASRGLRTALVDKGDFASGTSSKSSKLIHGGLRYLQQHEFGLVFESLAERQTLIRNAPHLVSPLPFLIPLFGRAGVASATVARSLSTALWLYDLTGGWRIGSRHQRVGRDEALSHLPSLRTEDLVAGFVYPDARADDARLVLAVLRTAVLDHGAVAANYADVTALVTDRAGNVRGARVSPAITPGAAGAFGDAAVGPDFDVRARAVVNATGVWADELRGLAEEAHRHDLRPAKGIHVAVRAGSLPCDIAAVLPVRGDRRSIFVVPWPEAGVTYVGTTDTDYDGPLDDPACTPEDVDYLLSAVNASTTAALAPRDVTAVWSGLRPLLAARDPKRRVSARTADLSRRHSVRTSSGGLVTVTGGKLTTYRRMAEDTMAAVSRVLGGSALSRRSVTRRLALRGAPREKPDDAAGGDRLFGRYGTEAGEIRALCRARPELNARLSDHLPYLAAEVVYAVREEMAQSVDDVLARRTRAVLQDGRAAALAAPTVASLMAAELGWTEAQASGHAERFTAAVRAELERAGIPSTIEEPR